jgi:hypothetical protein
MRHLAEVARRGRRFGNRLSNLERRRVLSRRSLPTNSPAIAAFIVAAMIVAGCGAWHLLRGRRDAGVKKSFSMALWMSS